MSTSLATPWVLPSLIGLSGMLTAFPVFAAGSAAARVAARNPESELDNTTCLTCHDSQKGTRERPAPGGDKHPVRGFSGEKFAKSVHARMRCVACHTGIVDSHAAHQISDAKAPDCAICHEALWEEAKKAGVGADQPRLETVAKNIETYKESFHAQADKDTPSVPKASCTQCHDTHAFHVPSDKTSVSYGEWRREVLQLCASCHAEQLEAFATSIHGTELRDKKNDKAPVCIDCHTSHEISDTAPTSLKLLVADGCGSCHKEQLASYRDTYHGQANKRGSADTATCHNCHGSHAVLPAEDPKSTINAANRQKTCQSCHDGKKRELATPGFVSFGPHANAHDFGKYPQLWMVTKFLQALLTLVFAFFWVHSGLWYFRAWQDRMARVAVPPVRTDGLAQEKKFLQRFPLGWRMAHLAFALTTMTLLLTGTSVLASLLGGAQGLGLIHRVAASVFIGIFAIHGVYLVQSLLRDQSFRWFGPDSLLPNRKDLADCIGMFKWFVGRGPKPRFERWTYFEKFDYWAVFFGVFILGSSGLVLAFPGVTARFLPGWMFNIATVVHGEEALLAAVFLFTVHFFHNHFRPDKLPPPDIAMFTGLQSLTAFRADHPAQYQRLRDSGELPQLLVDGPSQPLSRMAQIVDLGLIAAGLVLLVLAVNWLVAGLEN